MTRNSKTLWSLAKNCKLASSRCSSPQQAHPVSSLARSRSLAAKLLLVLSIVLILLSSVSCVVVYQVRFISTKNGRTDYALQGESVELSCHYIMKDEAEDVKQLVWSKDGKNFLRWRKNTPGLEVLSYTFKGHVDPNSTYSHITLHNVTLDMHGKYKCLVKTDLGSYEAEENFVVISKSHCRLNDWRIASQPTQCRELLRLDCKNMFPKPVPSCGLWNGKLDKFIRSVMVDISEEPQRQTYRVRYADKFELRRSDGIVHPLYADLLQYSGHLMFKCDISVPETSWRLSFAYRMFDFGDGCNQDPLEAVERMRMNYSLYVTNRLQKSGYLLDKQPNDFEMLTSNLKYEFLAPNLNRSAPIELNCWQKPRLGTLARLSCNTKSSYVKLTGANLLECQSSGWVPVLESQLAPPTERSPRARRPPRPSRRAFRISSDDETLDASTTEPSNGVRLADGDSNDLEEISMITTSTVPPTEFETIPTTGLQIDEGLDYEPNSLPAPLTPAQLAVLLPTCVSTRRHQTSIVSNRLPLLDETRILESLDSSNKKHANNRDMKHRGGSIFNFSSSAAEGTKAALIPNLILLSSVLTLVLTSFSLHRHRQPSFFLLELDAR